MLMNVTDESLSFKNSKSGPVAKFVSVALPHITGETVKPETVAICLQSIERRKAEASRNQEGYHEK